jgi:hypothetical protein
MFHQVHWLRFLGLRGWVCFWAPASFGRLLDRQVAERPSLTTFSSEEPEKQRLMLSAMVCWRRRMVPLVQPDMCGVIKTFESSWKGCFDGKISA